jgi:hypothetical protein
VPEEANEFLDFFVFAEVEKSRYTDDFGSKSPNVLYHYVVKSRKDNGEFGWTLPREMTRREVDTLAEAKEFEFRFQ